jgi:hypothetical protein
MLADTLRQEAERRANSQEGMESLVRALLHFLPIDAPRSEAEAELVNAMKWYVIYKRCYQIHRARWKIRVGDSDRYTWSRREPEPPEVRAEMVHAAHEQYLHVEQRCIKFLGELTVIGLKKKWGKILSYNYLKDLVLKCSAST